MIEAVFEELAVKQNIFAEVEQYVSDEAVLASNTSSLSAERIGVKPERPERPLGFRVGARSKCEALFPVSVSAARRVASCARGSAQ
ncbi:hypothetical protein ATY41_01800 [Leifsonia xyli subsp. xyli]|uniref:3-hydroxyacyl-CoA dehydrogenase NAD binding domain-containing protein n=1 Tax=Leifsonia xyli subsp. xyli TaxID=59736 RepID=A0A1E2SKV8_LEIXY|nr:hypothetical protein ATY41_01800 [Leifsonia xyli subsp. xyli]